MHFVRKYFVCVLQIVLTERSFRVLAHLSAARGRNRSAGRIIAAILQALQAVQDQRYHSLTVYTTEYSTYRTRPSAAQRSATDEARRRNTTGRVARIYDQLRFAHDPGVEISHGRAGSLHFYCEFRRGGRSREMTC